jgi:hypothetical protein
MELAAEAVVAPDAEIERLRDRVDLLEAIARLNADTIRRMQRPATEAGSALYWRRAAQQ